jgi:hypothetical protein
VRQLVQSYGLPSSLITQAEAVLDKVKSGAMGDVATNKVEMHPQIKSLFELLEDIERELKLLADLMEKHEEDRRKLAEAEAKLQAAKEKDPQMQKAETQKLGEQCVRRAERVAASGGQVQAKAQEVGTKITRCEDQLHHHGHHVPKDQHEQLTQRLGSAKKGLWGFDMRDDALKTPSAPTPQTQEVRQPFIHTPEFKGIAQALGDTGVTGMKVARGDNEPNEHSGTKEPQTRRVTRRDDGLWAEKVLKPGVPHQR